LLSSYDGSALSSDACAPHAPQRQANLVGVNDHGDTAPVLNAASKLVAVDASTAQQTNANIWATGTGPNGEQKVLIKKDSGYSGVTAEVAEKRRKKLKKITKPRREFATAQKFIPVENKPGLETRRIKFADHDGTAELYTVTYTTKLHYPAELGDDSKRSSRSSSGSKPSSEACGCCAIS
jgi:hypothetical protein